jgi:hypothetical protein
VAAVGGAAGENGTKKAKPAALKKEVSVEKSMEGTDFTSSATTKDGRPWNLKVASWNINGIRAWLDVGAPDSWFYCLSLFVLCQVVIYLIMNRAS